MIRGGTLLIWGHVVKGQGQLRHSVFKTLWTRCRLQFFAQSLSNFIYKLWIVRGGTLLIWGHRVKCQGQLWHSVYTIQTTVFDQSLSNFTCKLKIMRGGTLLVLGNGVIGQGQPCPPQRRGCHALCCLVITFE